MVVLMTMVATQWGYFDTSMRRPRDPCARLGQLGRRLGGRLAGTARAMTGEEALQCLRAAAGPAVRHLAAPLGASCDTADVLRHAGVGRQQGLVETAQLAAMGVGRLAASSAVATLLVLVMTLGSLLPIRGGLVSTRGWARRAALSPRWPWPGPLRQAQAGRSGASRCRQVAVLHHHVNGGTACGPCRSRGTWETCRCRFRGLGVGRRLGTNCIGVLSPCTSGVVGLAGGQAGAVRRESFRASRRFWRFSRG